MLDDIHSPRERGKKLVNDRGELSENWLLERRAAGDANSRSRVTGSICDGVADFANRRLLGISLSTRRISRGGIHTTGLHP